jgi:LysR family hydrogen peroxide-inducible transcriptional activator
MIRPTLRQLEYAVAVAERRSFHAAADDCFVSQPGLSAQIQQLESVLGTRLFERDRRKVLLTTAGEAVIPRARDVLTRVDDLLDAARAVAAPLSGPLRLGVIPTVAPYLLPTVMPAVRRRYPDLRLLLREEQTPRLLQMLAAGELDVLLLALEADLGAVRQLPLFQDPFVVALPQNHPLAKRKTLSQSDMRGRSVLLLEDGHCLRDQAMEVCNAAGATEFGDFRASSLSTLTQMVAAGIGLTLLPALALDVETRRAKRLQIRRFKPPAPRRTIGLAWRPTSARSDEFELLGASLTPKRKR